MVYSTLLAGAWYGMGVYVAAEAGTSASMYSGKGPEERFMYMCKALTGDFVKVDPVRPAAGKDPRTAKKMTLVTAPSKDPNNPSIKYDSVVDNDRNPKEFVLFTDSQVLPEYIITFTMQ